MNYSILLDVSLLPVLICWFQQIIDWIKGFKVVMVNAEMETQTLTVYNYIALLTLLSLFAVLSYLSEHNFLRNILRHRLIDLR